MPPKTRSAKGQVAGPLRSAAPLPSPPPPQFPAQAPVDDQDSSSDEEVPEPRQDLGAFLAAHPNAPKLAKRAHKFAAMARQARAKFDPVTRRKRGPATKRAPAERAKRRKAAERKVAALERRREFGELFPLAAAALLGPTALRHDEWDSTPASRALGAELAGIAEVAREDGDEFMVWLALAQPGQGAWEEGSSGAGSSRARTRALEAATGLVPVEAATGRLAGPLGVRMRKPTKKATG